MASLSERTDPAAAPLPLKRLYLSPPKWLRLAVGVLALWPLTAAILLTVVSSSLQAHFFLYSVLNPSVLDNALDNAVLVSMVGFVLTLGFFLADAILSSRVPRSARLPWALVLLLTQAVGFIPYWYFYWWRSPEPTITVSSSGS
jgi:hypothetical protein